MPWNFALSIECGEEAQAQIIRDFLTRKSVEDHSVVAGTFEDQGGNWWCIAGLENLQIKDDKTTESKMIEIENSLQFYLLLQEVSGYRYALCGLETEEFRLYDELLSQAFDPKKFRGLVLSDNIYSILGTPEHFERFSKGYFWFPLDLSGPDVSGPRLSIAMGLMDSLRNRAKDCKD